MGKEEDIGNERKAYESDTVWNARKSFLEAHWDGYEDKDQLECYSQLFINVNMIGCLYSPSLMAKIKQMGAGIMEQATKLNNERKFVLASRGRAEANEVKKKDEQNRELEKKKVHDSGMNERIRLLRNHMLPTQNATAEELMKMCERVQLKYHVDVCADGVCVVYIRNFVVFKHKFVDLKYAHSEAMKTVTNCFLQCEPSVSETDSHILFNEVPLSDMYKSTLQRRLIMAARTLGNGNGFDALQKVFQDLGLYLKKAGEHMEGSWKQRMKIIAGDLLVAQKDLGPNESVKAKLDVAVDQMCQPICEAIRKGTLKITDSEDGLVVTL